MKIILNGESKDTDCTTLAELLMSLDYAHDAVATAINGVFVPAIHRDQSILDENDDVDVVAPMSGG